MKITIDLTADEFLTILDYFYNLEVEDDDDDSFEGFVSICKC